MFYYCINEKKKELCAFDTEAEVENKCKNDPNFVPCPPRPSVFHKWQNGDWVLDELADLENRKAALIEKLKDAFDPEKMRAEVRARVDAAVFGKSGWVSFPVSYQKLQEIVSSSLKAGVFSFTTQKNGDYRYQIKISPQILTAFLQKTTHLYQRTSALFYDKIARIENAKTLNDSDLLIQNLFDLEEDGGDKGWGSDKEGKLIFTIADKNQDLTITSIEGWIINGERVRPPASKDFLMELFNFKKD